MSGSSVAIEDHGDRRAGGDAFRLVGRHDGAGHQAGVNGAESKQVAALERRAGAVAGIGADAERVADPLGQWLDRRQGQHLAAPAGRQLDLG